MDFGFTEEQRMLQANIKAFMEKEIIPLASERDRNGPLTRQETVAYIKKLMPFGFYNGDQPQEYGGMGIDSKTHGLIYEELAYAWAGLAGTVNLAEVITMPLFPEDIRKKFIPRIAAGELIHCAGITEPNAGTNSAALETTATLEGDHYVINGTKTWISDGTIADVCVLLATTDKSLGPKGISLFLVEQERSPFQVRELHKMGLRAFPTAELIFDNCRVPKENNLMHEEGSQSGYLWMMKTFDRFRPQWALHAVGISQAAIDASVKYARERLQFGKAIGSFQLVQNMIYEMVAETEASRLLAYRALDMLDKGEKCRWESSLAKGYATEAAVRVTSNAIEIHGAMGLSEDYPIERYFRDARAWTIPDGTTEVQKLIVGREKLGISAYV